MTTQAIVQSAVKGYKRARDALARKHETEMRELNEEMLAIRKMCPHVDQIDASFENGHTCEWVFSFTCNDCGQEYINVD